MMRFGQTPSTLLVGAWGTVLCPVADSELYHSHSARDRHPVAVGVTTLLGYKQASPRNAGRYVVVLADREQEINSGLRSSTNTGRSIRGEPGGIEDLVRERKSKIWGTVRATRFLKLHATKNVIVIITPLPLHVVTPSYWAYGAAANTPSGI
ncbi:hypothetical protein BJV77DRAFT_1149212 [Russula vinacea]|nr:hypothetical protein BJV77DRAFT_1149212 [Russula vinacea]